MKHGVYAILVRAGLSYCARCQRVLPVEAFRRCKSKPHGINYHCKACNDAYKTGALPARAPGRERPQKWVWTVTDLQRILEPSGLAYCSKCGGIKARADFYCQEVRGRHANRHGLHSHCKACHATYDRASRRTGRPPGWPRGRPRAWYNADLVDALIVRALLQREG